MTIFRKIAEEFILDAIKKIQNTSISYDNGTLNRARAWALSKGRDLELSASKRMRLEQLITDIQALEPSEDSATKDNLLALITKCKQDLLDICTAKKHHTGSTEIAVTDVHAFITAAYEKICVDLKLIDTDAVDNTITQLKYYCAKACGRSVYEQCIIKSSQPVLLTPEKEKIIQNTLEFSTAIDKTINVAKKNTQESSLTNEQGIQLMVDRAEYIQREVKKIDHHPSNDYVIEYMNQAIESFAPTVPTAEEEQDEEAQTSDSFNLIPIGFFSPASATSGKKPSTNPTSEKKTESKMVFSIP